MGSSALLRNVRRTRRLLVCNLTPPHAHVSSRLPELLAQLDWGGYLDPVETLNTPHEIDLYIRVVAARYTYDAYPNARVVAELADAAVLELCKRIRPGPVELNEQLRLAAERGQRVRVTFADGSEPAEGYVCWGPNDENDDLPARVDDMWCGATVDDPEFRVTSVEILDA